jgi:hypothetical protein
LLLRRFADDDLEHLLALHNEPEVMRFINGCESTSHEEVEREYREHFAGYGYWAAVEKTTGDFVGWFALHPTGGDGPEGYELGYRIKRSAWGKGYATEGSRAGLRGLRRARRAPGLGADDGGQPRLPAGDGEGGPGVRAHVPPGVGGPAARYGVRRGRVRAYEGRLAAGCGRLLFTKKPTGPTLCESV